MNNVKEIAQDAALSQVARKNTTPARGLASPPEMKEEQSQVPGGKDLVQVDQRRRDEAILEENARVLLMELPDVRADKVEQAKRRLQEGFYDREEVLEKTADNIQQDASLNQTATVDEKHVQKAQTRLAQGYYEQKEVLEVTAKRIVDKNL